MHKCGWIVARTLGVLIIGVLLSVAHAQESNARRKVIIDQDAFGPAALQSAGNIDVVAGQQMSSARNNDTSGDGWRDEEVSHTLATAGDRRRTEVGVYPGAVLPTGQHPATHRALGTAVRQTVL